MDIIDLNKRAFDAIAAATESPYMGQAGYRRLFDQFVGMLRRGDSVLDIGCGPGLPVTGALVKSGLRVTGMDFSERMLEVAGENVPGAEFICGSVTEMAFESSYDGIVASYCLLCLDPENFDKAARNMVRALKPGGYCFIALNEPGPEGHREEESLCELGGRMVTVGRIARLR